MTDDDDDARSVFLGLYPLDPALCDPASIRRALVAHPTVAGIELPWLGHDETVALVDAVLGDAPHWRLQLTGIPATMRALAAEPAWGLASAEERMRAAAVAVVREQAAAVRAIEARWGSGRVASVLLHSAPRGGSIDAMRASLRELAGEDFGAAEPLLEHVDAPRRGAEPAKGFLQLAQELELGIGLALNWGRSAIELRDPDAVTAHLRTAREAGLLRVLTFSGVADVAGPYGPAWADAHVPPTASAAASLLTAERIRSSLEAAGPGVQLALKFGYRGDEAGAIAMLEQALGLVGDAQKVPARG